MNDHPETVLETDDSRIRWTWVTLGLIALVTIVRLVMNFRFQFAPGTDAAYYPLQANSLLLEGELMFPAPPLIFWIDASLAELLQSWGGLAQIDACQLACRIVDGVLYPWAALPIMMLGYTWSKGRSNVLLACVAATVLATLSPPVMRMASDFQKNSLGLVWMAGSIWAVRGVFSSKFRFCYGLVLSLFILLAALSHIGALGVTLVMILGSLAGVLLGSQRQLSGPRILSGTLLFLVGLVVFLLALYWLAPTWAGRLLTIPHRVMNMLGPVTLPALALSVLGYIFCGWILMRVWRSRSNMHLADLAVLCACLTGLAVLIMPGLRGIWSMRFLLMTPIPISILLMFWICSNSDVAIIKWRSKLLGLVAILLAIAGMFSMQGPMVSASAAQELVAYQKQIESPKDTLVIAPHGPEFWAGLFLETDARKSLSPEICQRYAHVLIVQPNDNFSDRPRPHERRDDSRDPRGPQRKLEFTEGHDSPKRLKIDIPQDARLIYDGVCFQVFEVK